MDDIKKNEEIALFKFSIIAPVLNWKKGKQKEYFQQQAEKTFNIKGWGEKNFKWTTFKKWLLLYRKYNFDGLKPNPRKDIGKSRKIQLSLKDDIQNIISQFQIPTVSFLYRYLIDKNIISDNVSEPTLRKFIHDNQISLSCEPKKERKKFEKEHIHELWTTDFMYGPYLEIGKKRKKQTFLCAIIDDCSRLIVGANFSFSESTPAFIYTLKDAVLTYGLPQCLYCDNGKVFSSGLFQLICAKLGIALIHSKPYDSPSRGKIERFFRTVRDKFIPLFYINSIKTIEKLNDLFKKWLADDYNNFLHLGINTTPLSKYLADLENVSINHIDPSKIDSFFYQSIMRTVRNDSTVIINNKYYEVSAKYIGKRIEIRFSIESPQVLYLVENDKLGQRLNKLDAHFNAQNIIHFKKEDKQ